VLPDANDPVLTDERAFIDQFRAWPNVAIHYVTAPGRGPFDNLEQLVWSFDSPLITSRHYLYTSFAETASAIGARSILDGAGGELGPSFHGELCEAELFCHFRWAALLRELQGRKRIAGTSMWRSFRTSAVHPLVAPALRRLRGPGQRPPGFSLGQVLQEQFVRNQFESISPWLNETRKPESGWPNHRRIQHRQQLSVQGKAPGIHALGQSQIDLLYPFLDKRVLEFSLAAPGHLKVRNGYHRYLIRAGLDKILPPLIQWRTTKVPFSPDYLRRYNAQRKQAQAILAEIGPNDPVRTIVNVERLKALANLPVAENERDTLAEFAARDAVPSGIYLIYFLRRFHEYRN
jgi:asparagine synthase (glutamine-hydrolysing)